MIEVSVSGHAEGLVASSAIDFFLMVDGSITRILSDKLKNNPGVNLPFQVLGIYVDAVPHDAKSDGLAEIEVRDVRRLVKFRTGQIQKVFELVISSENFYGLSVSERRKKAAGAFRKVSAMVSERYPDADGRRLSDLIAQSADDYLR